MEIVAAGALPSLLLKLAELLKEEYNLQKEVKGGIKFLQAELERMKAALEKISETPADKLDNLNKLWARDVRELSYDIEDKIDSFMVRCKVGSKVTEAEKHGFKNAIDRSLKWLAQPSIRRKFAIDIRHIKSDIVEVHERRRRYEVKNHSVDNNPVKVDHRAMVRYEDVRKLVGIDEATEEVIKILIQVDEVSKQQQEKIVSIVGFGGLGKIQGDEVSKQQQEKIVSIVGFGGLGKTTLAKVVYEKLKGEFDCSAFISVSQTPDMEKLFNNLLYELDKRNNISMDVIVGDLREFLQKKRYFIVIDDIWDISHWEHIRCALPHNNGGCKIITTTRILSVAEKVGGAYKMKPLCLDNSRILFYGRIFGHEGKDKCPDEELDKVSNKILTKCAGVPLAIITIASLLASKGRNILDWYKVYNSIGTGMEDNTDVKNMRRVLFLSYYNLPLHLKTCLLYLSVFPEDYEIDRRRLIWMWIAEGFIPGKHGLFEVGESYFNELINRSLIQPVYFKDTMVVSSCRVHDMVLDLICSLSSEENFITTLNNVGHASVSQKIRRLSLQYGKLNEGVHRVQKKNEGAHEATDVSMEQVRSVTAFSSVVHLIPSLSRFEVVRVLHLENCDLSNGYNLKYIGKLVHLKFLGLNSTKIDHLPEEIGNLQFLQVLDISGNPISALPFSIVQLKQLKCYNGNITIMGNWLRSLTSLEELSPFFIGEDSIGILQELGCLTELKVLDISVFLAEQNMLVECLNKLQNIQHLSISFIEYSGNLDGLVGLQRQSLRSLQLHDCWFSKLPVWINCSHVHNLSVLQIAVGELEQKDLETLGGLPALSYLDMYLSPGDFNTVSTKLIISDCLFPCLLHCKFEGHYPRVEFQQGAMPKLRSLHLDLPKTVWSRRTEIRDLGFEFENLPSIQDLHFCLRYGRKCSDNAQAALRNIADIHPNHPSISTNGLRY